MNILFKSVVISGLLLNPLISAHAAYCRVYVNVDPVNAPNLTVSLQVTGPNSTVYEIGGYTSANSSGLASTFTCTEGDKVSIAAAVQCTNVPKQLQSQSKLTGSDYPYPKASAINVSPSNASAFGFPSTFNITAEQLAAEVKKCNPGVS